MANCKNNFLCTLNSKLIFITFAIVSISSGPPYLKSCVTFLHSNVFAALNFRISECSSIGDALAHAEKTGGSPLVWSKIPVICTVVFILIKMHWIWITISMLWRPQIIRFKQMYAFSRLPWNSLKGRQKDVSSVAILWHQPRKWINRSKQQEEIIRHLDTVWLFKWKEVNRILKEYIFIYSSVSFSFFHRHLKSTEWP